MFRKNCGIIASVLIMVLLGSACSSGNSKGESSPSGIAGTVTPSASQEASGSAPERTDGPLVKYDPPIEVSVTQPLNQGRDYPEGDTDMDNTWTRGIAEELGIKITYPWQVDGTQYANKMNVTIASGDLPDIMLVNTQQMLQLVEAGKVEELTEAIDKFALPRLKEDLYNKDGMYMQPATFGGKAMALPYLNEAPENSTRMLWVRTDWLKALNLPEPKTAEDVFKIAEAFAKNDPDGDKKNNTFGIGILKDIYENTGDIGSFLNMFHGRSNTYQGEMMFYHDSSGKLVYGSIQPEIKTGLAKLQEMYKAGLIDKEWGTKDQAAVVSDIVAGKIGMWFGAWWNIGWPVTDLAVKDPKAEVKGFPIPSINDTPTAASASYPVGQYYVVRKGFNNPEALIKLANMWYDIRYAEDGRGSQDKTVTDKYITTPDQKSVWLQSPVIFFSTLPKDPQDAINFKEAIETGDTSKLTESQKQDLEKYLKGKNGDRELYVEYLRNDPVLSPYVIQSYYAQNNLVGANEFRGGTTKTMTEKASTLSKLETETFTRIIMGTSLDEFDKFVENWKKLGGDQITQEVNDWAASLK